MDTNRKFPPAPTARSSLRGGNLLAIDGGDSYIYYGQIAADKSIGFFKHRSRALSSLDTITSSPFMSRFRVGYPSIGRALRSGAWLYLGHFNLHDDDCGEYGIELGEERDEPAIRISNVELEPLIREHLIHLVERVKYRFLEPFKATLVYWAAIRLLANLPEHAFEVPRFLQSLEDVRIVVYAATQLANKF